MPASRGSRSGPRPRAARVPRPRAARVPGRGLWLQSHPRHLFPRAGRAVGTGTQVTDREGASPPSRQVFADGAVFWKRLQTERRSGNPADGVRMSLWPLGRG